MLDELVLAVIQGIAEWLPISSSGHLVIYQQIRQTGTPIFFDLVLHMATLFVIFAVFWRDIWAVINAALRLDFKSEDGKLIYLLIIGTIPTAIIGLLFKDVFESFYDSLLIVGIALIINGSVLYFTKDKSGKGKLTVLKSIIIGVAQGVAIVPGISRSGSTISAALYQGVERKKAAAFSFMLAIPAILGATILEYDGIADMGLGTVLASSLVAMVVGYVSLRVLLRLVLQKRLHYFSYYCWAVGTVVVIAGLL